jgi:ATP-binding cassette subfamily B protein
MKSPPKRTPSPPVLKYLLAALRPYPVPVFLLLGTIVFDSLFDTAIPVVLSLLLDQAATQRNLNLALFLGGGLAGGWLVSIGSQFSRDYLYAWVTSRVLTDLRVRVEAHLHERDFARLRELRPSDVSGALGSELARIENLLLNVLPSFLFAALYLLFSLVAMAGTDLRLATFVLVLLPLAVLGPRVLGHRASAQGAAARQEESDLGSSAQESFHAQPLLRTFDLSGRFQAAFSQKAQHLRLHSRRFYHLTNLARRTPNLTMQVTQFGLMLFGLVLLWQGQLGLGAFVAFNLLFLNISMSVVELSATYGGWLAAGLAFARLQVFSAPLPRATVAGGEDTQESGEGPISLEFDSVAFSYDSTRPLLRELSFSLEPGKRIAVVGPSGSGKSTLAALLSGLYRPNEGRVLWNGRDLAQLDPAGLHARLGIVFQENTILNASLEDNIRLGTAGGDVEEAVRDAGLAAWVADLPQALATPAGEAGGFLSGGQKQRLALARALVRKPGLLILDEATSALDPLSESLVNQTLRGLVGRTTVVHITHRLEGIRDYDTILVLDKGKVVESGTHDSLMAAQGLYAGLWTKQSGVKVSSDAKEAKLTPDALAALPLFLGCKRQTLEALSAQFVSETAEAGHRIIRQGTPGSRFFVVARGRVDVFVAPDNGGPEILAATMEDGDFFGEMSLLQSALTSATVTARIPTLLLALEKSTFQALISSDPVVAQRVREMADLRKVENARRRSGS